MSSKKCTAAAAAASQATNSFLVGDPLSLYRAILQQFQAAQNFTYSPFNPYAALIQQQLLQVFLFSFCFFKKKRFSNFKYFLINKDSMCLVNNL